MSFIRNARNKYLNEVIAPKLRKFIGLDSFEEAMLYQLNNFLDITKCKKAEGDLRKLQLADLELLKIFDLICKKIIYGIFWITVLSSEVFAIKVLFRGMMIRISGCL